MARNGGRLSSLILANLRASPAKSAVLGIGVVVLAVLLVRLAVSGPKKASADEAVALVPETSTAVASATTESGATVQPIVRQRLSRPRVRQTLARDPFAFDWLGGLASPTQEAPVTPETEETLALQMTMTSDQLGGNQMAIISGTVVFPGSWISGYEVREISRHAVTLRNRTGEIQLRLP